MKRLLPMLALLLTACATHQVRFDPWAGVPVAELASLKRGEYSASKEQLIDAAAATLEHEPYLHWEISSLDKANGLVKANAGVLREVQLRVAGADSGGSKLGISVPRRELKTRAKIYVKRSDPSEMTAYEPEPGRSGEYKVLSADVELDEDYFRSFTWRVLHDRTQVPFKLKSFQAGAMAAEGPVATPQAPVTPGVVPTPVTVDEGPRLPVRVDAGATPTAVVSPAP